MNKEEIKEPKCDVCGADTTLRFVKSSGMDIEPTGLFADCMRCGNRQRVKALNDKFNSPLTSMK